jgi:hypothetical protein
MTTYTKLSFLNAMQGKTTSEACIACQHERKEYGVQFCPIHYHINEGKATNCPHVFKLNTKTRSKTRSKKCLKCDYHTSE